MTNRVETKLKYFAWHNTDQTTWGEIRDEIDGCESVLDIGAGNGWLTSKIHESGVRNAVGSDIDTAILGLNDPPTDGIQGVVAAAETLPFKDDEFDAVIAKDIIEHLLYPGDAIREAARVLRKGGKLYIATPSAQSKSFYDDYTHIRPFTETSLRSVLEDNGFTVDRIYYTGSYPGVGRWMKMFNSKRLPVWVYGLARIGFRRGNIHAWAYKAT